MRRPKQIIGRWSNGNGSVRANFTPNVQRGWPFRVLQIWISKWKVDGRIQHTRLYLEGEFGRNATIRWIVIEFHRTATGRKEARPAPTPFTWNSVKNQRNIGIGRNSLQPQTGRCWMRWSTLHRPINENGPAFRRHRGRTCRCWASDRSRRRSESSNFEIVPWRRLSSGDERSGLVRWPGMCSVRRWRDQRSSHFRWPVNRFRVSAGWGAEPRPPVDRTRPAHNQSDMKLFRLN